LDLKAISDTSESICCKDREKEVNPGRNTIIFILLQI